MTHAADKGTGRTRKRANAPPRRHSAEEEAKVVLVLGLLASAGPFVVLGIKPLVSLTPLAVWEKVLLVGVTPALALMSLLLFARSSGARARTEGRAGAAVAGVTLLLAIASAAILLTRP